MKSYLTVVNYFSIAVIAIYALSLVNMIVQHFDIYAKAQPLVLSVVLLPLQLFCSLLPATIGICFARPSERQEHAKALIFSAVVAGEFTLVALLPAHGYGC